MTAVSTIHSRYQTIRHSRHFYKTGEVGINNVTERLFGQGFGRYSAEPAKDWQDALQQAAGKLIEHQYILPGYVDEIIGNVEKNGPYIVIVPGVAMPHAMAESENVLGTAIGFAKFPAPVVFDPADPENRRNCSLP